SPSYSSAGASGCFSVADGTLLPTTIGNTGIAGLNTFLIGSGVPPLDVGAANSLDGGAGNDSMFGAGGNDTLLGGADNDTLVGGAGDDSLDGNGGANSLVYSYDPAGVVV